MSPKASTKTAAKWRRTKHLKETLELVHHLDGTRTLTEAAEMAAVAPITAWRILATLRHLAAEEPELVRFNERREGRRVFHTVELLQLSPALEQSDSQSTHEPLLPPTDEPRISVSERAKLREFAESSIAYRRGHKGYVMEHPIEPIDVLRLLRDLDVLHAEVKQLQAEQTSSTPRKRPSKPKKRKTKPRGRKR